MKPVATLWVAFAENTAIRIPPALLIVPTSSFCLIVGLIRVELYTLCFTLVSESALVGKLFFLTL